MDFSNNSTQIILAIVALFAVGLAVTITVKKISKKTVKKNNLRDVNAGGDIVFGDKKTKTK